MRRLGNGKHAMVGLWILAGLVVAGVNGYLLMSLLDEPLAGYSSAVRNADRGFREYQVLSTAEAEKITLGLDLLASWFEPDVVEEEAPAIQKVPESVPVTKRVAPPAVELPTLTGIFTSQSTDGIISRLAVLDGRIRIEGDLIKDLTVKGISREGVSLKRGDQSWFLKAPEINYSLTTQ